MECVEYSVCVWTNGGNGKGGGGGVGGNGKGGGGGVGGNGKGGGGQCVKPCVTELSAAKYCCPKSLRDLKKWTLTHKNSIRA